MLRQTSQVAAYWHEVARTTPPPPPPLTPQQRAAAAASDAERSAREEAATQRRIEMERWGGSLPSDALRAGGAAAQRLANTHRGLADQIASLDPTGLRQVAHWAASTACARAGDTALDWEPALEALDQARVLPPPFDDPGEAWERLYGPQQLVAVIAESAKAVVGIDRVRIHPPAAALATVLAAASANPVAAAFDALDQAASAVDDPDELLSTLRHRFGLG